MKPNKRIIQKVGKTRIIPISFKILLVFICLLLLSNFTTNFINIRMNQTQVIRLTNIILVKHLKDMYTTAVNQNEIFKFSHNYEEAVSAIAAVAEKGFEQPGSLALGVKTDGQIVFQKGGAEKLQQFPDIAQLELLNNQKTKGIEEGSVYFNTPEGQYLSVYKFQSDWDMYLIRAELVKDMNAESNRTFILVSVIILILTFAFMMLGLFMFSNILRFIRKMTDNLYRMQQNQELELLDLEGASNDDITYLGMSFNSLSSTINNLLGIFKRFASQDVVQKAYKEHSVKLEGTQRELTILFSDIRGFTYMTETLGNDIINLLNIHYERAIGAIHIQNGIIGSIIGDALLAVYGTIGETQNKSLQALRSAFTITEVTAELRQIMLSRRTYIEETRTLSESEERVFKAIMIDVGVGIDGGTVFYGNIGSLERMTNTVIGDNVNSASRLEGLTRIYHVPIIVSEFVKDDVLKITDQYLFIELDTVQVKGKTEGKKVFVPLDKDKAEPALLQRFNVFSQGLQAYYEGDWTEAKKHMKASCLDTAQIFIERMSSAKLPENWNGIWTMTSK